MAAKPRPKARRETRAAWDKRMWERAMEEQSMEIAKRCGKKAAGQANYGWGDGSRPGSVSVATKVYGKRGGVLLTTAEFPSDELSHEWQEY